MKIGIITLAYDDFDFEKFYENIEKYFLPTHQKTFYFFTNKTEMIFPNNVQVYYANKNFGPFTNISELIKDVEKDGMQLLYYCGLNIKFDIETGSKMIPNDDYLFSSFDSNKVPMLYNLTALIGNIENKELKSVYGSYTQNFIDLIRYYEELELLSTI